MKLLIYAIFDQATAAYSRPFFLQTDSQATRTFTDSIVSKDSEFGAHPADYTLYRIGVYNDQTAKLTPRDNVKIATALELVAVENQKGQVGGFNGEVPDNINEPEYQAALKKLENPECAP